MDSWVEWGETRVKKSFFHEVQLICFQNVYSLHMFLGKFPSYIGSELKMTIKGLYVHSP